MSNQRRNRIAQILIGQLSVALLIVLISLALIIYSQGWRINFKNFKIYKTGLIYLMINPTPEKIYIGDKEFKGKNEFYLNLIPGDYTLKITKDGFNDWTENIKINEEMVLSYKNVLLFSKNPSVSELTDQSKIDYLNTPDNSLAENAKNKLAYNKYEIWTDDNLVTRFSEPIENVAWYPDYEHIIYQQGNQIKIVDKDGFNENILVNLSSLSSTRFVVGGKGRELYFIDNARYMKAVIQ